MSGSGGGGGGGNPNMDCESISFNTEINSPQQEALDGLEEGATLDVLLEENTVVIVRPDTGDILGSINWSSIAKLIECITDGYEYTAVVREIDDGLVKIHVHAQ